jgi:hypothetical protein
VDSALVQLFRRTNLPDHILTYDETRRWPEAEREALFHLDILRRTEDAKTLVCDTCGDEEDVVIGLGREPRVHCRQFGLMPVRAERLQQWDMDFNALGRVLRAGLKLSSGIDEVTSGRIWMLGRRQVVDRTAEFFLVQGIAWPDSVDLLRSAARLQISPAPVILIPDRLPEQTEWRESGRALLRLSERTRLQDGQLIIDFDVFAGLFHQTAEAFEKPLSPTPVAERPALIEKFRKDHSCLVKDVYYWAKVDRTELNKWKNGDLVVPNGGAPATRIEKLLQRGEKNRV